MARSPWPHITTVGSSASRSTAAGEVAELDVQRAGDVPGLILGVLPDVEHARSPGSALAAVSAVEVVGSAAAVQASMPPASSPTMFS